MLEYMLLLSLLVALVIASMNIYTGPIGATYAEIKDGLDMVMGGAAS